MLSAAQILRLLEELSWKTIYKGKGIRVQEQVTGWSDDPEVGQIQASLSIMLEAATKMEQK